MTEHADSCSNNHHSGKTCWTLGVNPRQVLGTVRMPKVRSNNKGRGRRRTKENEDIQGKQRQCQANRHSEREEVDFMLDLCQGALCEELFP
jgi:hypothetical protein